MTGTRLFRPVLALAAAAALVVGLAPAQAAQAPLVVKDTVGDGNALNGQGIVTGVGDTSTGPAQLAALDIVSLTVANTGTTRTVKQGKKTTKVFDCTGMQVTLELGAAPFASAIYRVLGVGSVNPGTWWLTFTNDATTSGGQVQYSPDAGDPLAGGVIDVPTKVDGNKIIWTVSRSIIKGTGEKQVFDWSAIGAHSRTIAGVVTAPQVDELAEESFFKVCG